MASQGPSNRPAGSTTPNQEVWDVELLRVLINRAGKHISADWAIHPQIKKDLQPNEWKEISDLMTQVTKIVSRRFAQILAHAEPDPPGNA